MKICSVDFSIAFSLFAAGIYPEKPLCRQNFCIFGEKPFSKDGSALGLGINGKGLGYYYFGARYYDPELGQWISQDPLDADYNVYSYCYDDPVNYIDEEGLLAIPRPLSGGRGYIDPKSGSSGSASSSPSTTVSGGTSSSGGYNFSTS